MKRYRSTRGSKDRVEGAVKIQEKEANGAGGEVGGGGGGRGGMDVVQMRKYVSRIKYYFCRNFAS